MSDLKDPFDTLKDSLNDLIKDHLKTLQGQINDYFEMIKNILDDNIKLRLNVSEKRILYQFSLTFDKLKDPWYIPEILNLANYIIENNYNFFSSNWNTHSYYHHDRNKIIANLVDYLIPFSNEIIKVRHKKFNDSIKTLETKSSKIKIPDEEIFIKLSFLDYDLPHYDSFIDLLNKTAYFEDFYNLLPFQLRCLFENLLYDIFKNSLKTEYTELFFFKEQNRARDFGQLISLLDFMKDVEFKPYIKDKIIPNTITILKEIQKIGNYTVHDVIEKVTSSFSKDWKENVNLILKQLLACFKDLKGKNIEITDKNREIKIKEKLGIVDKSSNELKFMEIKDDKSLSIKIPKENLIKKDNKEELDVKEALEFFIRNLQTKNYKLLLDRFCDEKYVKIFNNLFTTIKVETGALTLYSNSFVIAIGVQKIFQIIPIYNKKDEFSNSWEKMSIEEQLEHWLADFKERVKLIYKLEL